MTSDDAGWQQPTPGVPGLLGDLHWVDSPDFGEERRIGRVYDVDPAPLARMLGAYLGISDGDADTWRRALADDDRDGPIHIAHLFAACQYAARRTGGGMPTGDSDEVEQMGSALQEGGFPAVTTLVRQMAPDRRYIVLDVLLMVWFHPIDGLRMDITEDMVGVERKRP